MKAVTRGVLVATVTAASSLSGWAWAGAAEAHGSMEKPISRVYGCYRENPENPLTAACRAAVRLSGTQAFYDWNGVRIGDAAGRHRQLIRDGHLCSADNPTYRGLDLARADWPATRLPSGRRVTLSFIGTAPHRGKFTVYVTRDGYNPRRALRWSDLQRVYSGSPALTAGHYKLPVSMPARTGRHVIYTIWQRTDSPEAFYACSDVTFSAASPAAAAAPATARTTARTTARSSASRHRPASSEAHSARRSGSHSPRRAEAPRATPGPSTGSAVSAHEPEVAALSLAAATTRPAGSASTGSLLTSPVLPATAAAAMAAGWFLGGRRRRRLGGGRR